MSKQSPASSTLNHQLHLADDLTDNPFVEWLSANKRYILFGFLAILALIILSYRFIAARTLKSERDFFQAQVDFSRFQGKNEASEGLSSDLTNLNQLETLINRHPELHAKYDGLIAQDLIIKQNITKALPFAESAFQRVKSDSLTSFYLHYAETSLLISNGSYNEALSQAQQLKKKMDESSTHSFGETLYLFNLIRLAILNQQLDNQEEEWQAWKEVQRYTASTQNLAAIDQLFKEGSSSLSHYIEARKQILAP